MRTLSTSIHTKCVLSLLLCIVTLRIIPVLSEGTATYNPALLPKLRTAPPFKIIPLLKPELQQDEEGWFCTFLWFKADAWTWSAPATQMSGWVRVNGATKLTSVNSMFNTINSLPSATTSEATFWAIIADYQSEYVSGQSMKFNVCGEKESGVSAFGFTYDANLILTVDFRPPPFPYPVFPGWPVGTAGPVNDCFPGVMKEMLTWDALLNGSLVFADKATIGGKLAAGGNVIANQLYAKLGSDYPNCPNACTGSTNVSNSFLVAGGYINFMMSTPGICGGFMQGNPTKPSASQLVVDPGCPAVYGSNPIDFSTVSLNYSVLSVILSKKEPTGAIGYALNSAVGGSLNIAFNSIYTSFIFYIPGDFVSSRGVFKLYVMWANYIDSAKSIIFNVAGTKVAFNFDMTKYFETYGNKIIFNFYEALKVDFASGIYFGTMLAPKADVSIIGGAVVNGQVIAKSLTFNYGQLRLDSKKYDGLTDFAGKCLTCAKNFYGPTCKPCDCKYNELCNDGVSGDGSCTCMPNFDATCTNCVTGFYGKFCNNSCTSTCIKHGSCSDGVNGTGVCLGCKSPFNGTECETCINTRWGADCMGQCSPICFEKKGTCDYGVDGTGLCATCGAPWGNGVLKLCDDCDYGHYGPSCQFSCSTTCAKHGNCSYGLKGNGTCLSCRPIYKGAECEECVSGYFGPDCLGNCTKTCSEYGTCNDGASGDGSCTNCQRGTTGAQCDECITQGAYGKNCQFMCKETCLRNGKCSTGPAGTGYCKSCKPRWRGTYCETGAATGQKISLSILGVLMLLVIVIMGIN